MLSEYWKNYGQNWAKSKLDFLLYELLHEQIRDFFLTEIHITKTQTKPWTHFYSFQIFFE